MARRRGWRGALVLAGIYSLTLLASMLWTSPFRAGVEAVAATGGWEVDQVRFHGGSYGFRLLYAVAEVDVTVQTEQGTVPVRLAMTRYTPFGWSVTRYERGPARPAMDAP